ncbi:unnamed protein product [Triticum turgidum subsp. durum]|uniref:Uncharacterized protein n=1 Tax=Triticum turgidum subsp. durum TaxID=4567 RepID=A0A9R0WSN1_TRITD|nr:unnamed protein product [Triticum turgidum subsp. durum]
MGRAPCCDKASVKKGPWSPEEDATLKSYIEQNGTGGNWIALPQKIDEEDRIILSLYISIGSRWSIIAAQLPGRTDNDIKNYWNTRLKKKLFGKQSRKDQRQHQFARQATNSGHKEEASEGAAGNNGFAAGAYNWHQHAMAMPSRPMPGSMVEGNRIGEGVDESIRKLLFKLGGSSFAALQAPPCLPPPMYGEAPNFVAPSVHTAPLNEGGIHCSGVLPALELDESFQFNQVKLDGLECFFGMGDQSMRWNEECDWRQLRRSAAEQVRHLGTQSEVCVLGVEELKAMDEKYRVLFDAINKQAGNSRSEVEIKEEVGPPCQFD